MVDVSLQFASGQNISRIIQHALRYKLKKDSRIGHCVRQDILPGTSGIVLDERTVHTEGTA